MQAEQMVEGDFADGRRDGGQHGQTHVTSEDVARVGDR
jgi:hypothetical protein